MAALKEGPIYDVTVESRTLVVDGVDVPIVHARPDGMPERGRRPASRRRWACGPCSTTWPAASRRNGFGGVRASSRSRTSTASIGRPSRRASPRRQAARRRRAARRSSTPPPICSSSRTTSRACRCSASAWAGYYTFKAAATRPLRRRGRVLRHVAHARRLAGPGPSRSIRSTVAARDVPDARDLRQRRPVDAAGRHRRAARRVAGPRRLRDRRRSKAPSTASCTTPTARCTAPTTPQRCWARALAWMLP